MKEIDKQIQDLKSQIQDLRKEKEKLMSMPPEIRLATFLHVKLCTHNHMDGCGWFYENDWESGEKLRWLRKSTKLLLQFEEEEVIEMVNIVKEI